MNDPGKRVSVVVFSGDLDRLLAAFIIASGAAASGMSVDLFFTFWGLSALRNASSSKGKGVLERMFGWMLPRGPKRLPLSKMDMMGVGRHLMKKMMIKKNVTSLPELMETSRALGVRVHACEMSMKVLGLRREELSGLVTDVVGVSSYLEDASRSQVTLFI
jgi:peroxiredoxin family protein